MIHLSLFSKLDENNDNGPDFGFRAYFLTDLRILQLKRITVSSNFRARILDFACNKVWIADLNDPRKCFALFNFMFFGHAVPKL